MPEKLEFRLVATAETKQAFQSAGKNAENLVKGVQLAGVPGGPGAPAAALAAPKAMERSLNTMVKLLQSIKKNTESRSFGVGGGKEGVGEGLGGVSLGKGLKGGQGLGKLAPMLGKVAGALGVAGAAIAAIGFAYKMQSKIAEGTQRTISAQVPTLQKLGYGGNVENFKDFYSRGGMGYFGETRNIGGARTFAPSETAGFALGMGQQMIGRSTFDPEVQKAYGKMTQEMLRNLKDVSVGYGIDLAEIGRLGGTMERYKRPEEGRMRMGRGVHYAVQAAERAEMGGARIGEFFGSLEDTLQFAVTSGFDTSNEAIIRGLGNLMSVEDERLKKLGPAIMRTAMESFGGAAGLQGGPGSAIALQAVWKSLGKGATMEQARRKITEDPSESLRQTISFIEGMYGEKTPMSRDVIMRTGILGKIQSLKQAETMIAQVKSGETRGPDQTITEKMQEGMDISKKRSLVVGDTVEAVKLKEITTEIKSMTQWGQVALKEMNMIREATQKMVTGLDSAFVGISNWISGLGVRDETPGGNW